VANVEMKLTHRSIPAMSGGILAFTLQCLRICWLEVLATRRLNTNCAADLIVAELAIAISGHRCLAVLHGAGGGGGSHGALCCLCTDE